VLGSLKADSEGYEEHISSVITLQTTLSEQIGDIEQELAELERIQAEQAAAVEAVSQGDDNQSGGSVGTAAGQDIADTGGTAAGQDIADAGGTAAGQDIADTGGTAAGQDIVDFAETFLGVGYVYGGTSPSGFDCSGLVYYVYTHFGYSVNRTAAGLAYNGTAVSPSELQAGDVLLFTTSKEFYIGHTGIYIGDGQFIHATSSGSEVKISSLSDYADYYFGARRIIS
jgi:cell wall-associated NlpC family hydrolase